MITSDKIRVYKKYSGNIENWDRYGKKKDKEVLEYEEWILIDEILDNLYLIEQKLTSNDYAIKITSKLNNVCDNKNTEEELKRLVGKYKV
jgi:hypothetical protein